MTYQESKTLQSDNQFRFACPIFGSEEKLVDCLALQTNAKIRRRTPGREGCYALMASCKCPTWQIEQDALKGIDQHFSKESKVGRLDASLLERIAPIIVQEQHIEQFGVDAREAKLMLESSGRKGKLFKDPGNRISLVKIDHEALQAKSVSRGVLKTSAPSTSDQDEATIKAAITGDMSAAINAELKKHAPAPAPQKRPDEPLLVEQPSSPGKPLSLLERARQARERKIA